MKKSLILSILLISLFSFNLTVKADGYVKKGDAGASAYENMFNAGPSKITLQSLINGNVVKVYGKSECSVETKQCTYAYFSLGTSVESYFEQYISCSGGETKIEYQHIGSPDVLKVYKGLADYNETSNEVVYWQEDYSVSCLSDSDSVTNGYTDITLNGSSSSGSDSSGGNVSGDYPSSDGTVDGGETGVITYYIVLGIIAIGAYGLLLVSKKYNLFKKI